MFIPLFLFFSLITLPKAGKPLIALLLVLSAAADYAMTNLGIIIDSDMVRNFAETNLRESMDFITLRSVLYVTFLGIMPAAAVLKTDIRFGSFGQELKQRFFIIFLCWRFWEFLPPPATKNMFRSAAITLRCGNTSIRSIIFTPSDATTSAKNG